MVLTIRTPVLLLLLLALAKTTEAGRGTIQCSLERPFLCDEP